MNQYIFGYGSLINLQSLSKTMQREISPDDITPVKLYNYKRVWNLKENIYSDNLKKNISAIFLNLEYSTNDFVNGIIFKVSNEEFEYLAKRERNYASVEVSSEITNYNNQSITKSLITVYIAIEKRFLQNDINNECFVMKNYIKIVESGCSEIGELFLKDYKRTTANNPFNILDGTYTFIPTT